MALSETEKTVIQEAVKTQSVIDYKVLFETLGPHIRKQDVYGYVNVLRHGIKPNRKKNLKVAHQAPIIPLSHGVYVSSDRQQTRGWLELFLAWRLGAKITAKQLMNLLPKILEHAPDFDINETNEAFLKRVEGGNCGNSASKEMD